MPTGIAKDQSLQACEFCGKNIIKKGLMFHQRACEKRQSNPKCTICGKPILVKPSHVGARKTCSKECGRIHASLTRRGDKNTFWKGGRKATTDGYIEVYDPLHHRANIHGYVREHIKVVEEALGPLPPNAVVHHKNGIKTDNRLSNLEVWDNNAEHTHRHKVLRAYQECGHADWLKCRFCKQWDKPENLTICRDGSTVYHKECLRLKPRQYVAERPRLRPSGKKGKENGTDLIRQAG